MTRTCSKCGVEKPIDAFPRRWDRSSGHGTICLVCGRLYRKAHYALNRDYYILKGRRGRQVQRARVPEELVRHLRSHPCIDCGESDIRVLQFDHVDPRTKAANVATLIRRGSWARALAEIEKCVSSDAATATGEGPDSNVVQVRSGKRPASGSRVDAP